MAGALDHGAVVCAPSHISLYPLRKFVTLSDIDLIEGDGALLYE